jgi:hypothetical protein
MHIGQGEWLNDALRGVLPVVFTKVDDGTLGGQVSKVGWNRPFGIVEPQAFVFPDRNKEINVHICGVFVLDATDGQRRRSWFEEHRRFRLGGCGFWADRILAGRVCHLYDLGRR